MFTPCLNEEYIVVEDVTAINNDVAIKFASLHSAAALIVLYLVSAYFSGNRLRRAIAQLTTASFILLPFFSLSLSLFLFFLLFVLLRSLHSDRGYAIASRNTRIRDVRLHFPWIPCR